ncbi:MAG: glutamyl-tRNA reductase [Bacteroidota bacterium]
MNIACISISHHTAPLEVRERLWFSDDEIRAALPRLKAHGLQECVLFSTCNRTELYAVADEVGSHTESLKNLLIAERNAGAHVRHEHLFTHVGVKAVEHLFRVASGIDSMVIGDVQILSQIKDGLALAEESGTNGFLINRLFQSAFHVGKRVRTETVIGEGAISVSYAAVELAGRIFEDLSKKTALVIGAGETAELTAKHLRAKKIGKLFITNRTAERAEQLARRVDGSVHPFEAFREQLPHVDILISSVETERYILSAEEIKALCRQRPSTALFIMDIGVPRNIDPAARALDNVFLHDIDSLGGLVDENLHKRRSEIPKVEQIIREELAAFAQWNTSLEANPTIIALRDFAEQIRRDEVEKNISRFGTKDRELLELLTRRIVNKILHPPIINLKNGQDESLTERLQKISTIRKLFGIDASSEEREHDR